jgi:hypothetical protein
VRQLDSADGQLLGQAREVPLCLVRQELVPAQARLQQRCHDPDAQGDPTRLERNVIDEPTEIIPAKSRVPEERQKLVDSMREQPGMLALLVLEWVVIGLIVAAGIALVFLMAVGGYALVRVVP